MKILVFHWKDITHPYSGGAERLLHLLMKNIVLNGYSVTWFCSNYNGSRQEENVDGIKIVRRGGQFSVYLHAVLFYLRNRRETDVVIDNITGVPWFTPFYCLKPKISIIYHVGKKETFFTELPVIKGLIGYPLAFIGWLLESSIPLFYANVPFITFSYDTKTDLIQLGILPSHVLVAQEGISLQRFKPNNKKDCNPLILYVGRLVKNKGIEHLIEAMKLVLQDIPTAKLSIIGAGPFEERLKKLTRDLKLENTVVFHGFIPEQKKIEILQKAHVLVHPSLREGWATPVLEANACLTPAIGSDVTGINCTIKDGVTGFLFPYGDVRELAKKIVHILRDRSIREAMASKALEWAQEFDERLTIRRFVSYFNRLAQK